jgi:uncharacterized protein YndB with AHSA1/START domain
MNDKPQHATITLEKLCSAPQERVFSEYADPASRALWSAPSESPLIYDETDFRIGGKDLFRFGPKGDPKFRGETRYLLIIPNSRVVSSETLHMNGRCIALSLTTLDLGAVEGGTHVTVTLQMVSFVGAEMFGIYESGNNYALENLARRLSYLPRA